MSDHESDKVRLYHCGEDERLAVEEPTRCAIGTGFNSPHPSRLRTLIWLIGCKIESLFLLYLLSSGEYIGDTRARAHQHHVASLIGTRFWRLEPVIYYHTCQ